MEKGAEGRRGGSPINEGTLPETHTEERCERAEVLELEAEFGSTEHSPTEAEATSECGGRR